MKEQLSVLRQRVQLIRAKSESELQCLRDEMEAEKEAYRRNTELKIKMLTHPSFNRPKPPSDGHKSKARRELSRLVHENKELKEDIEELEEMIESAKEENERLVRESKTIQRNVKELKKIIERKTKQNMKLEEKKKRLIGCLVPKAVRQVQIATKAVREEMSSKKAFLQCMRKIVQDERSAGIFESNFLCNELASMLQSWQTSSKSLGKLGSSTTTIKVPRKSKQITNAFTTGEMARIIKEEPRICSVANAAA